MARPKVTSAKMETAQRKERVLRFKMAGLKQVEIANQEGITEAAVSKIIKKAFAEINSEGKEIAIELRSVQYLRSEQLHQAHWQQALRGSKVSGEMVIKLMDRMARLFGLDKPLKVANTDAEGTDISNISQEEKLKRIEELLNKRDDT